MRFFHYARRTEETCWQWIVRFLRFHKRPSVAGEAAWRHPRELGPEEVRVFLTQLATAEKVAASTHNQVLRSVER